MGFFVFKYKYKSEGKSDVFDLLKIYQKIVLLYCVHLTDNFLS